MAVQCEDQKDGQPCTPKTHFEILQGFYHQLIFLKTNRNHIDVHLRVDFMCSKIHCQLLLLNPKKISFLYLPYKPVFSQ